MSIPFWRLSELKKLGKEPACSQVVCAQKTCYNGSAPRKLVLETVTMPANNLQSGMLMRNSSVNTTDSVYREIRSRILANQFPMKQKINQNQLADELQVSRTPVIKALHMLEAEGLVDNKPNSGFYIHVPTLREITELFMLRQSLEMIATMHAAEYGTNQQFDELEALFSDFIGVEHIDKERYFIADKAFHNGLIQMCGNQLMHKINESMQIMNRSFSVGLLRPPEETLVEHRSIIDALRSRNPERAQDATRAHTETTKHHLLNINQQIRALGINSDTLPIQDALEQQ